MVRMTKRSLMMVGLALAGGAAVAEADGKTSKDQTWKVDPMCSLFETGKKPALMIKTIIEGNETVSECPENSGDSCKVGKVHKVKAFLIIHCTTSYESPPEFECKMEYLDLTRMESRVVDEMTMYFGKPTVKEYDRANGTVRVGPVYAGLDLTVTGMKPTKDGEWAFGGSPDVVGMGGAIVKSKIQLHGKCQVPPKD